MNKWKCDHPGCENTCVGVGGAVGLRAIGWYFKLGELRPLRGPKVYCPVHVGAATLHEEGKFADASLNPVPCRDDKDRMCSMCAIEAATIRLQHTLLYTDAERASGTLITPPAEGKAYGAIELPQ